MRLYMALYTLGLVAAFFLVVVARRVINKEKLPSFGLQINSHGLRSFAKGILIGIIIVALYIALSLIWGSARFQVNGGTLSATLFYSFMGLCYCAMVALLEETIYRGYAFPVLRRKVNIYVATILPSLVFAGMHFQMYSSSKYVVLGLFNAFVLAIALTFLARRTETIMIGIGIHLVWNYWQIMLFSNVLFQEPTWINLVITSNLLMGSSNNAPESGLIFSLLVTLLVAYSLPGKQKEKRSA